MGSPMKYLLKLSALSSAFISHMLIDKLIYQIYQLVGGFPAKLLSLCNVLVKTYSFT